MKEKSIFIFLFLLLCFSCYKTFRMYTNEHRERQRIENSFKAANQSLVYYKTKNNLLAAQNEVLNLHYNELKEIYPKVIEEIKNLDIKPSHITQYAETVVKSEKSIVTHLRDSIIRDTIKAKVFNYQDSFYSVKGIAVGDTQ